MCCFFAILLFLGPRVALVLLWLARPVFFMANFGTFIIPILGIIFLPWTTLFYIVVFDPLTGMNIWGWLFVAMGLFFDIGSYGGSTWGNKGSIPGVSSTETSGGSSV